MTPEPTFRLSKRRCSERFAARSKVSAEVNWRFKPRISRQDQQGGSTMRLRTAALATAIAMPLASLAGADAASATTIIVYTDPMTLARRTLVLDTPGPHRVFLCMAPPAEAGCTAVPVKQRR